MVARVEQHIHNALTVRRGAFASAQRRPPTLPARPVHGFPFGVDDNFYRVDRNGIPPAGPKTTQIPPGRAVRADA
jgi:hypothetical protein